jgi:hypothetical protein
MTLNPYQPNTQDRLYPKKALKRVRGRELLPLDDSLDER